MSPEEHLNKIVAKCRELLAAAAGSDRAKAGWRATIAAIEFAKLKKKQSALYDGHEGDRDCDDQLAIIIADWPEELL